MWVCDVAFNCASTGIGISAFRFSTSMGTVHYRYWHLIMVTVLVLAFLHLGSVPVLAHSITGTGIPKWCPYRYWHSCTLVQYRCRHSLLLVLAFKKWCPYWYWHFCTLVQYRYRHSPLPVLAFKNGAGTGTGIFVFWFIISIGMGHYW